MRFGIVSSGRIVSASLSAIACGILRVSSAKTCRSSATAAASGSLNGRARQDHVMRQAAAGLAGGILGDERDADALAGKRMFGQVPAGQPLGVAGVAAGNVQPIFRQRIERLLRPGSACPTA